MCHREDADGNPQGLALNFRREQGAVYMAMDAGPIAPQKGNIQAFTQYWNWLTLTVFLDVIAFEVTLITVM